jgi:hypothetical protein
MTTKRTLTEQGPAILVREGGKLVAQCILHEKTDAGVRELRQRAKLIAAAPELVACLQNVLCAWDRTDQDDMPGLKSPLYDRMNQVKALLQRIEE